MNWSEIDRIIVAALAEDMPFGDVTTESTIPPGNISRAKIVSKQDGILAGLDVAERVFRIIDESIKIQKECADGDRIKAGQLLATLEGRTHALLKGERTALNLLQRLSGIATLTAEYCKRVEGYNVRIVDTRKTVPGMRLLDKYAVRMGGGKNHRFGLSDGVLIKDNHIKAAGGIRMAIEAARKAVPHTMKIEIEVADMQQVAEALENKADIIMLDNMTVQEMKEAVLLVKGKALTEASGGVNLESVREIAATGVDIISVGELTHSVKALDIHMKII